MGFCGSIPKMDWKMITKAIVYLFALIGAFWAAFEAARLILSKLPNPFY